MFLQEDGSGPRSQTHPTVCRLAAAAALLSCLALAQSAAPQKETPAQKQPPIKQIVELVLVNVTVTDPYGRRISGLEKDNFRILEDGVEQEILHFSSEEVPVSIGLVLDLSASMGRVVDQVRRSATGFLLNSNPEDEFMVVGVRSRAEQLSPFTHDATELESRLLFVTSKGLTALFDALYLGINLMSEAHTKRRALIVFTDAGENHSRYTQKDIKNALREADVQLYFIALAGYDYSEGMFRELADITGGQIFHGGQNSLPDLVEKIGTELRNQYVIAYSPSNHKRDGKWRKIRLQLRPPRGLPPLNTYYRTGYTAPSN